MTRTWCLELAADGITVNAIAPGPVATELFDRGHPPGGEKRQRVIDSIPVRRVGTPDDIARAAVFLLSPTSGYITGQTLFVCGGTSISGAGGEQRGPKVPGGDVAVRFKRFSGTTDQSFPRFKGFVTAAFRCYAENSPKSALGV